MSRRRKITLSLALLLLIALILGALRGGACRDPEPPDHPVPAAYDDTSTPIAAPAAK